MNTKMHWNSWQKKKPQKADHYFFIFFIFLFLF